VEDVLLVLLVAGLVVLELVCWDELRMFKNPEILPAILEVDMVITPLHNHNTIARNNIPLIWEIRISFVLPIHAYELVATW